MHTRITIDIFYKFYLDIPISNDLGYKMFIEWD